MNQFQVPSSVNDFQKQDSYIKGQLFEKYIISLFNKKHFTLYDWRKSKRNSSSHFDFTKTYPDLELIFCGKRKYRFAVECKWRRSFFKGAIRWATREQIDRYKIFERQFNITTFIAIGVGGDPSNPKNLYVTPLDNIYKKPIVFEQDLIEYERNPRNRFFLDTVQLRLF